MNILITNDDGVRAEGIAVLARAAKQFGKVTVMAPASQCSAMSHRITLVTLAVEKCDFPVEGVDAYQVEGTPADCVKVALDARLVERPDVVLSGINHGYNVGYDVVYSGTVGAAVEALMNGIPAIAFSRHHVGDFGIAEEYIGGILESLLAQPLTREIWNVNFPTGSCNGILRDRKVGSLSYYCGIPEVKTEGDRRIVTYPPMAELDPSHPVGAEDSDIYAVQRGYISIGKVSCPVL